MSANWTPNLEYLVKEAFQPLPPEERVQIPFRTNGIAIAAENIQWEDDTLHFRLLVSYSLAAPLYRAFRSPGRALQLVFERPETAQSTSLNLVDPGAEYGEPSGSNFLGDPPADAVSSAFLGQSVAIEMAIPLQDPGRGPHIYVTGYLQGLASNTLGIDATTAVVSSTGRN